MLRWMNLDAASAMVMWRRNAEEPAETVVAVQAICVRVSTLNGEQHDVAISSAADVIELSAVAKAACCVKDGSDVQLCYGDQLLTRGSLSGYGMGDGAEVEMIIEPPETPEEREARVVRLMNNSVLRWIHCDAWRAWNQWRTWADETRSAQRRQHKTPREQRLMHNAMLRWMNLDAASAMVMWRRNAEEPAETVVAVQAICVRVSTLNGEQHDVAISSAADVIELSAVAKAACCVKDGSDVQLCYGDQLLTRGSLSDYGMGDGAEVEMIIETPETPEERAAKLMRKSLGRWRHRDAGRAIFTWMQRGA